MVSVIKDGNGTRISVGMEFSIVVESSNQQLLQKARKILPDRKGEVEMARLILDEAIKSFKN